MKIYTKKGDEGSTSLLTGERVAKHHPRIEAYGTIDELNSWLGLIGTHAEAAPLRPLLLHTQDRLFALGSLLAAAAGVKIQLPQLAPEDITELEESMDSLETELPELKNFVLAGGTAANAHAHIARCVCRRAERLLTALQAEGEPMPALALPYLNRLSDWLFMLARWLGHQGGVGEVVWQPRAK